MPLDPDERRVVAAVDADALVADLRALVRVPSVTGDEAAAQARMAELCATAGLEVETWDIDLEALRATPGFPGTEAPRSAAIGLHAWLHGDGPGPRVVLNGHIDVVDAGTAPWSRDPWGGELDGGRLYGRGACDMKGGLVAALHALRALRRAGAPASGEALLASVVSEEDGGLGTFASLERLGPADAAVIPEPSCLAVVVAQAGALTFRGEVRGRAAHAAFRREGESAIDRYVEVHARLQALERERNADVAHPLMRELELPYPISVGRVEAGTWSSTVPDHLVFEGRIGVQVGEPPEQARAALEAAVGDLAAVQWTGGAFASGATPPDHPLARTVAAAVRDVTGAAPPLEGVPYGADLRLFTERGIPCVICGPGDVRLAHAVDEHVPVAELVAAARVMAVATLRLLRGPA